MATQTSNVYTAIRHGRYDEAIRHLILQRQVRRSRFAKNLKLTERKKRVGVPTLCGLQAFSLLREINLRDRGCVCNSRCERTIIVVNQRLASDEDGCDSVRAPLGKEGNA